MNVEKIICENEYAFEEVTLEEAICNKKAVDEIDAFLKGDSKCLVVCGKKAQGKSFAVKKAIVENISLFSRVYYIEYDKEKHQKTDNVKQLSIDNVLKKNIYRLLLSKGICSVKDNAPECFEKSLDESTLIVIDNYDIPAFSPYLRHLVKLKAKMIVITRGDVSSIEKGCSILSVDNTCINPLCERLKKSYCEYFKITEDEFYKKTGLDKATDNTDKTNEFLLKLYSACSFDDKEKELLRTLGAMLYYLAPSTEIKSSEFGVFDANSVKYYLQDLSPKLEKLIFLGFVNISGNGGLYFDRAMSEFVMTYLLPDASNCPAFVSFVKKQCDFTVVQSVKDTEGALYTYDNREYEGVLNWELFDLYTHFLKTDKNCFLNVYNFLICNTLESFKGAGLSGSFNHLVWRNKNAYFSVLSEALGDKELVQMLYDFDERYDLYTDVYTDDVLANLDVLRIAGGALNGLPKYMYFDFEICFCMIDKALCSILAAATQKGVETQDRMSLLYDAIRIVFELFGYCSAFDTKLCTYNKRRSLSSDKPIQSTTVSEIDYNKAVSISMAYNVNCVKLYGTFQRLLYEYKRCSDIADLSGYNSFYKSLFLQKQDVVNKAFCDISSEFSRIVQGYDSYYDFFSKESTSIKIWQSGISDKELEEKINTCKRLAKRGFDKGTRTGAEDFAKSILKAVDDTKNATYLVSIVLSGDYEIGNDTYLSLLKNDFASKVCLTNNISKTDKALLLECCIDYLLENDKNTSHFELVISVVRKLITSLSLSQAQKECICERLSLAYIKALSCRGAAERTKQLFFDYFNVDDMSKTSAVCCVAYASVCLNEKKETGFTKKYLSEAAKTVAYENMYRDSGLDLEGYVELVKVVCGEKCAKEIKEDIDLCSKIFD